MKTNYLWLLIGLIAILACEKEGEDASLPCMPPDKASLAGEWSVTCEEYFSSVNSGNTPTLSQSGNLNMMEGGLGTLNLNGKNTEVSFSYFPEDEKLALLKYDNRGEVLKFESNLYDIEEWSSSRVVLLNKFVFFDTSFQEFTSIDKLILEKDPQEPCGEEIQTIHDLGAFVGEWNIEHIYYSMHPDTTYRDTSSHHAVFNANGTGQYNSTHIPFDALFNYHSEKALLELHRYLKDVIGHSNLKTDFYKVIEISQNEIVLEKENGLWPSGVAITTLNMTRN